jgi:hypothetical protein
MKEELVILRSQPWFAEFIKQVVYEAPPIRIHDPSDPHSVEKWKADSARMEGYFQCLLKFGYNLEDLKGDRHGR